MKNTLLLFVFVFVATFSAQAQDSTATSALKPTAGDKTIEAGSGLEGFHYGGTLKFRKFISDQKALRLSTNIQFHYSTPSDETTYFYSAASINPGIERHFSGTSRLSPYIGIELPLTVAYSRSETPQMTIKGAWYDNYYNRSFKSIGLNAVTGVDFYIVKNFYVGLEFGAGIAYRNYNDVETDYKENEHHYHDKTDEGGSSISFNTFANGGFRVGFVF